MVLGRSYNRVDFINLATETVLCTSLNDRFSKFFHCHTRLSAQLVIKQSQSCQTSNVKWQCSNIVGLPTEGSVHSNPSPHTSLHFISLHLMSFILPQFLQHVYMLPTVSLCVCHNLNCLSNALHSSIGQNIKSHPCPLSGVRSPARV